MFLSGFLRSKKTYEKKSIFWQKQWTNPFAKCRFFFDFVRTSLLRSKKHYYLSRISKNVSFWLFLLKKACKKRSISSQKPWTNPFAKCQYFLTFLELHFSGLKRIVFYPEYQKMFLFGFLCSKEQMRKRSIFSEKPWTNPFAKCRFFRLF